MRDVNVDTAPAQSNSIRYKEPQTPPYSIMIKTPGAHSRSNSYSIDNVYDPRALRPRAYSSSVFDFDYIPYQKSLQPPIQSRMPATPTQSSGPLIHGHVTPPETSPYSSDWYASQPVSHSPVEQQIIHARTHSRSLSGPGLGSSLAPTMTPIAPTMTPTVPNVGPNMTQVPVASMTQTPAPSSSGQSTSRHSRSQSNQLASSCSLGSPAQIYSLCKNQKGCRTLQYCLQEGDPATVTAIFDATLPHIVTLMTDPFGNYFCQRLIEKCDADRLGEILATIHPHIVEIALGQHGTRALQRIIENVSTQEQVTLLSSALDGSVVRIIRDANGNHVIQKCLVNLKGDGAQFIYNSVFSNILAVGTHRHGCCVLQRCLDNANPLNKHMLVSQIIANSLALVRDPFGNYVCQYVVDLNVPEYTCGIIAQLLGNLTDLSMQKFSSNVVEKCLRTANAYQNPMMIHELMARRNLQKLLLDPYGNYVIQTALESSTGDIKAMAVQAVQHSLHTIRTPFGRRITSKLKALTQDT